MGKLLTPEQIAEIDERHEALTQWYANADKKRGYHTGKAGAENQSHHDRKALRGHITALESEITELHNDVGFYRCCALSGEIPDDSVKPSALLKQEQES